LIESQKIRFDEEIYLTEDKIHFIDRLDNYYLGTKYLIIEVDEDKAWRSEVWKRIIGYGSMALILFMLFGFYLAKLFVKPMRDSILLLDRFIKDTTHELNTPLSAILANIELMDTEIMIEKNKKKLNRINIAAKTVSTLYQDLTYLTLEHEKHNEDVEIAIRPLIKNRVEYFDILAKSKKIDFKLDLHHATILCDRKKFTRVIDNLLSNAIKYNKRGGAIKIILRERMLSIADTGIGIKTDRIPYMFDRYMRFNKSEGGFGVGLSIVKKILDEYKIDIKVYSKEGEGTKMVLRW
jgi:two-component system OmpR family sensor kinase